MIVWDGRQRRRAPPRTPPAEKPPGAPVRDGEQAETTDKGERNHPVAAHHVLVERRRKHPGEPPGKPRVRGPVIDPEADVVGEDRLERGDDDERRSRRVPAEQREPREAVPARCRAAYLVSQGTTESPDQMFRERLLGLGRRPVALGPCGRLPLGHDGHRRQEPDGHRFARVQGGHARFPPPQRPPQRRRRPCRRWPRLSADDGPDVTATAAPPIS